LLQNSFLPKTKSYQPSNTIKTLRRQRTQKTPTLTTKLLITGRGQGVSSIGLEAKKLKYNFELGGDDTFRLIGNNKLLLEVGDKEFNTGSLVYTTKDPIIRYHYEQHGQATWKILKVNFFESYPTNLINRCQGYIIVGGPCKTSDVSSN
jgi:hypothetical protein